MKKIVFVLASAALLFTACSDNKGEGGKDPVEPTLSVTPATLEFPAEGATQVIKITTNQDWTVTVTPAAAADWLGLDAGNGKAGENLEVEVTAEPNEVTEARSAVVKVTAGTLTKNVTVSQLAKEEEVVTPPAVDQNTVYELVSTSPLVKASELVDGKLYVVYSNHFNTKCWKEANGELTMAENTGLSYTTAEVFEFVEDEEGMVTSFPVNHALYYGDWSAGYWKSLSANKYISTSFGFTETLDNAFHFEYANNWGCSDAYNELNVFDVYEFPATDGGTNNTIWYTEKADVDTFHLAPNEYQNTGSVPTTMRKWVVYEVAAVEE